MKFIALFFCFIFSFSAFANNIIVNGTRFIYPENEREITVQLSNSADRPALTQAWLDNGDANATPDTIKTPFLITPPISRVDAKSGQTLRIKLADKSGLPTTKESLWWLNVLEIPPSNTGRQLESQNVLQLAIRSRFKFIYRPSSLGNREAAPQQLVLRASGNKRTMHNPPPFYITVTKISRDGGDALNDRTVMLAPQTAMTVTVNSAVRNGETLVINNINDYGSDIAIKNTVK